MSSLALLKLILFPIIVVTIQIHENRISVRPLNLCYPDSLGIYFTCFVVKSNMRLRGGKRGENLKVLIKKQRLKDAEATYGLSHFGGQELIVPQEVVESIAPPLSSASSRRLRKPAGSGIVKTRQPDLQLWSPFSEMRVAQRNSGGISGSSSALDSDLRSPEYAELCNIINGLNVTSVVDIGSGWPAVTIQTSLILSDTVHSGRSKLIIVAG